MIGAEFSWPTVTLGITPSFRVVVRPLNADDIASSARREAPRRHRALSPDRWRHPLRRRLQIDPGARGPAKATGRIPAWRGTLAPAEVYLGHLVERAAI